MKKDIHTEHCCATHGCQYELTEGHCTVAWGEKKQSFPCECCDADQKNVEEVLNRYVNDKGELELYDLEGQLKPGLHRWNRSRS